MKIIDNSTTILGDEIRQNLGRGSKLRIAASCFSIYAYEALKAELKKVESVQFIFTTPTFVPSEVTDKIRKERREFFIPKTAQESSVYGTEFEIQLRNKLNQKAIARECAAWVRKISHLWKLQHLWTLFITLSRYVLGEKIIFQATFLYITFSSSN